MLKVAEARHPQRRIIHTCDLQYHSSALTSLLSSAVARNQNINFCYAGTLRKILLLEIALACLDSDCRLTSQAVC
jgi:hypothetical protein